MFTGIVEAIGKIINIDGNQFTIQHPFNEAFAIGESISLSGMCATVLSSSKESFLVEIIKESRNRTTFGRVSIGAKVNLERSAIIGQRNSGHTIQGHIDEVGTLLKCQKEGDYWLVRIGIGKENRSLVVQKGSIALNGVSLTISGVSDIQSEEAFVEVSLISHTWEHTTFHLLQEESLIHVEYDVMGRYIAQYVEIFQKTK